MEEITSQPAAKSKPEPTIYQVLRPLFLWTTLQGLTPFAPAPTGFVPSRPHLVFSLLLLAVCAGISVRTIVNKAIDPEDGLIANITETLELYITNANMMVAVLVACLLRNRIITLLDEIHTMDLRIKMQFPRVRFDYRRQANYFYALMVLVNIYMGAAFAMDVILFSDAKLYMTITLAYAYVCPKLISTHVVAQYCYLNAVLRKRFRLLNAQLSAMMSPYMEHVHPSMLKSMNTDRTHDMLEGIRMKHYQLTEITMLLNRLYGVRILFTSLQVFVTLLSGIFYCIRVVVIKPDENSDPRFIVPYTINVVFISFAQLTCIAVFASETTFEAKRTGCLLHKFKINDIRSKKLEFEVTYFSLQLMHHNVDYNACRVFKIDESLLLSIVGVICTYLVIVIQFEFGAQQAQQKAVENG